MTEFTCRGSRRFPVTDLSAETIVVVPDDLAAAPPILRLQRAVGAKGGRHPDIVPQKDFSAAFFRDVQVIACGNMVDNAALRRLYTARCCFADTFFPGGSGYFIKSISDPFGHGKNSIAIGASTREGLFAAFSVFEDRVRTSEGSLGRVHAAQFRHPLPPFPDESHLERMIQAELDAWGGGWQASPFRGSNLQSYAWYYYLTDHPVWGRAIPPIFAGSLAPWRAERRDRPEAYHCLFNLHSLIHLWDLIEDSLLYTDQDRRKVVEMFGELLRHQASLFYLDEEVNPPGEIRQNHTTFLALNLAVGHDYLLKRYGIQEFAPAAKATERIFAGQADCYKPNDDGGVGYAWLVPRETLYYLLYKNDYRYIANGQVADLCKFAVLTTDNMRSECNYGDTAGYSLFSREGWEGRLGPLLVSTWHTRNPQHLWMLNWLGVGKTPSLSHVLSGLYAAIEWEEGRFALKGCKPEEPADLLGICPMELPEPARRWVRSHAPAPHRPDPSKCYFDKLSLRRNFAPEDEYLLLEGVGTFCHGHEDSNAIIRLTWKNRAWLGDGDYIRAAPKFHNALVVIRDGMGVLEPPGEGGLIPPLAALNYASEGPDFGLVQTEAAHYNGVDWRRNVFWGKGRFFAVIDQALCRTPGAYHCRCLWRLLGEVEQEGPVVHLHQQGKTFYLHSGGGVEQEVVVDPHEKDRWKTYPYADGIFRVLHQKSTRTLQPGESLTYLNLLTPHAELSIERLGELAAKVVDGPRTTLLGVGPVRLGEMEIEARMFALSLEGDVLTLQGVERLGFGDRAHWEEFKGELQTLDLWGSALAQRLREVMTAAPAAAPRRVAPSVPAVGRRPLHGWSRKISPAEVLDVAVEDAAFLASTEDGRVVRLAVQDGAEVWACQLDEPATRLLLADVDGDGALEALAGMADSHLLVLEGQTGTERWRRRLKSLTGRGAKVSALAVADLEGSGRPSILAGNEGWYVNAFDPDGRSLWANWVHYHAITALAVADVDRDGRAEIVVGTEYSTPLNVHNSDGSCRWTTFEEVGSEGNATTPRRGIHLTCLQLSDVDGDGVQEIVYGTADGWIYAVEPLEGTEVWHSNIVGEVKGLIVLPEGIIAASEYGELYGFSPRGELRWRVGAAAWIRGIAPAGERIAVAADRGVLLVCDLRGARVGTVALEGEIRGLWPCGTSVVCSTVGGRLNWIDLSQEIKR